MKAAGRICDVQAGDIIDGRFRVERRIGAGGMGTVVCATHLQLGEPVAIKFLNPEAAEDDDSRCRFLREARTSARLRNEHVARLMDYGVCEDGSPILVMEFLAGEDLGQALHRRGPLPVDEVVEYLLQACEALAEAHARGLVHRDLKPSNLFLTRGADGDPLVKVLDFGISKSYAGGADDSLNAKITGSYGLVGSPAYMSPEQISGQDVCPKTDIWALGVVMYECLIAECPFERRSMAEVFVAVLKNDPPPLQSKRGDVPESMEKLCGWCLHKATEGRCPSVVSFAEELFQVAPTDARRVMVRRIRRLAQAAHTDSDRTEGSESPPIAGTSVTAWKRTRAVRRLRPSVRSIAALLAVVPVVAFVAALATARLTKPAQDGVAGTQAEAPTSPVQVTSGPDGPPARSGVPPSSSSGVSASASAGAAASVTKLREKSSTPPITTTGAARGAASRSPKPPSNLLDQWEPLQSP